MVTFPMSSMVSPLKGSILHPGPLRVKFEDLLMGKFLKKWFSFNVQDQETLNVTCPIVRGSAVCTQGSMPDFTNIKFTMDRLTSFIWIFAQQEKDTKNLASKLGIKTDEYGFLTEAQRKLRPVETDIEGIYIAGCAQGPKDIADAVAHANAAASKVQGLFARN